MAVIISSQSDESFLQTIQCEQLQYLADIEPALGGQGQAPAPFDLLFGAWGACTNMTLQVYCRRKGWPLHRVETTLQHQGGGAQSVGPKNIQKTIRLWGPLNPAQVTHLGRVAEKCPVHLFLMRQAPAQFLTTAIERVAEH